MSHPPRPARALRAGALVASALALTCAAPRASRAEVRPGGVELGAFGGFWQGSRNVESASTAGLHAAYNLNRLLSLDVQHSWVFTAVRAADEVTSLGAQGAFRDTTLQQGAVSALINLSPHRFTPFFGVGAGWLVAQRAAGASTDVSLNLNVSLGVRYFLTDDLALRAGLGMWMADANLYQEPYEHFSGTVGLSYSLGGERDIDGDGVKNSADPCPTQPEDLDSFEDGDGCPDPDNDKDGVKDVDDKCPLDAEDKDEDRDEDGCPDVDDDKDGVSNLDDKCAGEAEDKDGFEDGDGCPDPDNDQDGLKDAEDKCPDAAETRNGFKDDDGCPDGDKDGDGIFDEDDKCAEQPETRNGLEDADGCPDAVSAETAALMGLAPDLVFGARAKQNTLVNKVSSDYLARLAARLKAEAVSVRVHATCHGCADPREGSKARGQVIKRALVALGVPEERVRVRPRGDAPLPEGAAATQPKEGWVMVEIIVRKPL